MPTKQMTEAEWTAYWLAYDRRLEASHAARLQGVADDAPRKDGWKDDPNHPSLCPAGNPYAGRG